MVTTITRAESPRFDTPGGNTTTPLTSSRVGAKELLVLHQTQLPGGTNPLHAKNREALVVVLAGAVDVVTETETLAIAEGDAALIPPSTLHRLSTTGDAPAQWLVITPAEVEYTTPNGEPIQPIWAR